MPKCCYYKCTNRRCSEVAMFRFPTHDKERLKLWLRNSGNSSLESQQSVDLKKKYICAAHFLPAQIHLTANARIRLKVGAVPVSCAELKVKRKTSKLQNLANDKKSSFDVLKVKKPVKSYSKQKNTLKEDLDSEANITLLCRICFVEDENMKNIVGTCLQKMYERLTGTPFEMFSKVKADVKNKNRLKIKPVTIWDSMSNNLDSSYDCNIKIEPLDVMEESAHDNMEEPIIDQQIIKSEDITFDENEIFGNSFPSNSEDIYAVGSVEDRVKEEVSIVDNVPGGCDQVAVNYNEPTGIVVSTAQDTSQLNELDRITKPIDPWVLKSNDSIIEENESLYHDLPSNPNLQDYPAHKKLRVVLKKQNSFKLYKCNKCHKTFKRKCLFRIHRTIHSGKGPYQCNICERVYIYKRSLDMHYHSHTGDKSPFKKPLVSKAP